MVDCIGGFDLWYHAELYLVKGGPYLAPGSKLASWDDLGREMRGYANALWRPTWLGGVKGGRKFVFSYLEPTAERMEKVNEFVERGQWIALRV